MPPKKLQIGGAAVDYHFDTRFSSLKEVVDRNNTVLITDEHVFAAHSKVFKNWNTIVLKPGEAYKVQATVDSVIDQLIGMEAGRNTTLVGVGGGVITDLTGYIASVFMRGVPCGFVPTTILAMVDAAIGGKNGIDVGVYKNMVGTIRQPSFLLFDTSFFSTLPQNEWRNGFAEIIKHACIKDAAMFRALEGGDIPFYHKRKKDLAALIQRNALLKTRVVQGDELERGDRKLLNFGHTLGHALENQYELSHGEAVAIGMAFAANLSASITGFRHAQRVVEVIRQYDLPVSAAYDRDQVINILKMDKKKAGKNIHYILLDRIGKARIEPLSVDQIYDRL